MRKVLAVAAMVLGLVAADAAIACSRPGNAAGIESALVDWINAERGKKGLSKLQVDSGLDAAAGKHACKMAGQGKLSHDAFASRMRGAGFGTGVENVARSTDGSADAAARIWKKSSQHWSNILNRGITKVGIGTAESGGRTYFVFMGGKS